MSLLKIKPFSIDSVETFSFANANIVANLTSGNANLGNLATANYFSGNGSMLTGIVAGNITGQVANALVAGTVYASAQSNITSVGTLTSLTVGGTTDLGAVANVKITGGSSGYVLKTDGSGNLTWSSMTSGTGNANVAGSNTQIQFNDGTNLSASGNLTFDVSTLTLTTDLIAADGYKLSNITGANVTGQVSYAATANSVAGANVSGAVSYATTANAVAGANVSGAVAYATTANAVAGANVSGTVANATYATSAGYAGYITNGTSNVNIASSGGNVTIGVGGTGNVVVISTAGIDITGNISANNANFGGVVFANGNIETSGNFKGNLVGDVSGNVSGNITGNLKVGGPNGAIQFTSNYNAGAGHGDLTADANITYNSSNVTFDVGTGNGGIITSDSLIGTIVTAEQNNITTLGTLTGLSVSGDATITGNLTITGTTTTVNSTVTKIVDPMFELGGGVDGAALSSNDGKDRGVLLHRYSSGATVDTFMGWDNSNGEFAFGSNVSVTDNVVTFNAYGNLRAENITANNANFGGVVFANGNITTNGSFSGNLVGNVTGDVSGNISGNITVSGSAGSIQFADSNSKLTSSANLTFNNSTGVLTVGGASSTGLVSADFLEGTLNANSNAQPNITSVGTLTSLAVSGTTDLGAVGNITISGGSANYFLKTDGSGTLSWSALPSTTLSVDTYTGDGSWTMKTLSSTPLNINYTLVAIGGVFQPREAYDVTGAVITFTSPPPDGAIVEITIINGGTAGSAGYVYQGINSSSTAIAGVRYLIDTSGGAVTLTLPSSASLGDEIGIIDATGNASTNNITVARNGGKIEGASSNLTVSTDRSAFTLVYYNSTQGWVKTQK